MGTDDDTDSAPWFDGVAMVDAAAWSLACRRARVLSQRELAAAAGLSQSTVQRLEAGAGRAPYDTVARVLAATSYELVAVDSLGRLLDTGGVGDGPRDRSGRRLPVHLGPRRTRPYLGPRPGDYTPYDPRDWWGWHSIAWSADDPAVPQWTYHKRWRPTVM